VRLDAHLLTCHRALRDSASPTRLSSSISHVRPRPFAAMTPSRHRRTLNVVGWRYKRVEHRVGGPSVRSGAAERPKSTVGVDLHMCFAVDHVQDQPVRPDDERGALDRSDEREKAWGDPVRAGH
jgi:hypothetical protein